jgi:VWFA-related protein
MVMRTSLRAITAAVGLAALGAVGVVQGANPGAAAQQPTGQQPTGQPAAPAPPPAPDATGQQPTPVIRSGINYVRVDVIVSDKDGKPVMDLKEDEFSLAEDGKPQKIDAFSVVNLDHLETVENGPPRVIKNDFDEEREASRPDVRLFVILLDDYHVKRGNDMAVRKPLIEFIQNQLAPADMIAIMYPLTPVTDLRFTRDRESSISAIEKFLGRKFDYTPKNLFEEKYAMYPAQTVERVRNQVTMDALKGAAMKMGSLREGRKSIILVSEGFTSILPAQLSDPNASMPGYRNPYKGQANAPVATPSQQLMADSDLISDMQQVFKDVNRQNTSIYSVDPRGLAVFEYDINQAVGMQQDAISLRSTQDTLQVLAENTDGRAIINRNDLAAGMKQIIRDSSGYYLLGYNSSQAPTDGKFHSIKVNVKRRGVDVRARKGYWAYTLDDVARANAPKKEEAPSAVMTALTDLVSPTRDRAAHFWIGTARGENGKTRVTLSWEPVKEVPGQRAEDPPARVALTAITPDGRPIFRGRVPEEAPAPGSGAAPMSAVAPKGGSTSFEVPPGQLELKMVIEGARGQVIDAVGRDVTVPDFSKVTMSFGTPRVFRVRTIPEMQAIRSRPDAVPTAEREFSRTDRLFIRADAYAPGGASPSVTARLLNRAGQAMSDLVVKQTAGGPAEIDLPLSSLAAGEYLVELNAKSEGGSSAQELIAFRVGR